MKLGFIGLGIMGKPMVKNLLKAGHEVLAFDIVKASMDEVAAAGAQLAESPQDVAANTDQIILMLPNSPHVKEVVMGEKGLIKTIKAGTVVIDMSSIAPAASQEVAAALAEKSCEMLDAPVSGGEPKAIDGTLSIMVGGKKEVFEKYKDVLLNMGASAVLCGDVGAGNTTKLANQIVVALNIAAVAEAFVLASKAGVDPEAVYNAIRGGLAGSTVMDAKGPMMLAGNYKPGFKLDLHAKDLLNALDTAREVKAPLLLTPQVYEIIKTLQVADKGQNDHSGIVEFYESLAKIVVHEEVKGKE